MSRAACAAYGDSACRSTPAGHSSVVVRYRLLSSVIVRTTASLHEAPPHSASYPNGLIPARRHSHRLCRSAPAGLSSVVVRYRLLSSVIVRTTASLHVAPCPAPAASLHVAPCPAPAASFHVAPRPAPAASLHVAPRPAPAASLHVAPRTAPAASLHVAPRTAPGAADKKWDNINFFYFCSCICFFQCYLIHSSVFYEVHQLQKVEL